MDWLCNMHLLDRSGVITGTRDGLAKLGRCSAVHVESALQDLSHTKAANVTERNGIVTVTNRRMRREYITRSGNRLRKQKQRCTLDSHAPVTPYKSEVRSNKSNTDSEPVFVLKGKIGELYRRPNEEPWQYIEESLLAEVARRPKALEEFAMIFELRRRMPPDDRKRFFPQTVESLLQKWAGSLDKARTLGIGVEKPKPVVRQKVEQKPELTDEQRKHYASELANLRNK